MSDIEVFYSKDKTKLQIKEIGNLLDKLESNSKKYLKLIQEFKYIIISNIPSDQELKQYYDRMLYINAITESLVVDLGLYNSRTIEKLNNPELQD